MGIIAGNIIYLLTDEKVYIKLDQIDSVRITVATEQTATPS